MTPRQAFARAIESFEGLYQDDPADLGNIKRKGYVVGTMRGVTPAVWARFKGIAVGTVTPAMMQAITLDDAVDVYEAFYYAGPGFDRLPWGPSVEVWCDIGWGSGPVVAIKQMQRMIGAHPDGVIGPRTVQDFEIWIASNTADEAVNAIADWRCAFYNSLVRRRPKNRRFIVGWLRRANWYRPTNAAWWNAWHGQVMPPVVQTAKATPRPAEPTVADDVKAETDTQKIVQAGTLAGGALTGAAGIFQVIPPWALGIAVVALVAVGALWALKSFGVIKRTV